jgi:hypothetical protein
MALRFRRSFSFGPLRWTFTRRGVSTSLGIKGARVSLSSDGRVRETLGLPGTGVSYTRTLAASRPSTEGAEGQPVPRRPRPLVVALVVLVALALAWLLTPRPAHGFPGDLCRRAADCTTGPSPQYCLADGPFSDVGRCRPGRVLP